jgi:hypothetical protein
LAVLKATLTFVKRKQQSAPPVGFAPLDDDDREFLGRHVDELRRAADAEGALLSRFQHGSGLPALLKQLLTAKEEGFVKVADGLAKRLTGSMDQSTNPSPGVLALIVSGTGDKPDVASLVKLDATNEAASFAVDRQGQVKLRPLRDLLPAPGQLQKGVSWPDPRTVSDAIVIDRNQTAAQYFFNAYELKVSSTPKEAEGALAEAIIRDVPRAQRQAAMQFATTQGGRADQVASEVRKRYPQIKIDREELGASGAVPGYIRPGKVAAHMIRYRGDGITVLVPSDRLNRVSGPSQAGGGWEMTIRFSARPHEDSS